MLSCFQRVHVEVRLERLLKLLAPLIYMKKIFRFGIKKIIKKNGFRLNKTETSIQFLEDVVSLSLPRLSIERIVSNGNDEKLKISIFMQVIDSLNKVEFKAEIESLLGRIMPSLKRLAVEFTNPGDEQLENQVNKIACQFYAAILNKIEKGKQKEK